MVRIALKQTNNSHHNHTLPTHNTHIHSPHPLTTLHPLKHTHNHTPHSHTPHTHHTHTYHTPSTHTHHTTHHHHNTPPHTHSRHMLGHLWVVVWLCGCVVVNTQLCRTHHLGHPPHTPHTHNHTHTHTQPHNTHTQHTQHSQHMF